jgi:hypothetical protein
MKDASFPLPPRVLCVCSTCRIILLTSDCLRGREPLTRESHATGNELCCLKQTWSCTTYTVPSHPFLNSRTLLSSSASFFINFPLRA